MFAGRGGVEAGEEEPRKDANVFVAADAEGATGGRPNGFVPDALDPNMGKGRGGGGLKPFGGEEVKVRESDFGTPKPANPANFGAAGAYA
jgi:hypothetical protein